MPKFDQTPSHKVVHSYSKHIPCTEEVMGKAFRGWEGEHSLILLDQIRAETKVEFWLPDPRTNCSQFSEKQQEGGRGVKTEHARTEHPATAERCHSYRPSCFASCCPECSSFTNNIFTKWNLNSLLPGAHKQDRKRLNLKGESFCCLRLAQTVWQAFPTSKPMLLTLKSALLIFQHESHQELLKELSWTRDSSSCLILIIYECMS